MGLAAILQIINVALPAATQIVLAFKHNATAGTTDVTVTISQADAAFAADLKQAQDWLAAHPATPPSA